MHRAWYSREQLGSLAAAAVLLGLVNAIVKPIVVFFTLPFTIITLGLFLLVINAAMLELVAMMLRAGLACTASSPRCWA